MPRFDHFKGLFGLLPTPYRPDLEIHTHELAAIADFCCRSGQHGIVWPVMVGEFYFLGEDERVRNLDAVLAEVNGRLPVVFGCAGISIPQAVLFARAAQRAGADGIIAMAPARTGQATALDMFARLADAFAGPIIVQNADGYAPLSCEQIVQLAERVPQVQYVKEERFPCPHHVGQLAQATAGRIRTVFGGAGGKYIPDELRRGGNGCMPACELGDLLARVYELWWSGDSAAARALHRRVLPLINLESHPFMRYILRRRGVIASTVERGTAPPLTADDRREISILLEEIADQVQTAPFGEE